MDAIAEYKNTVELYSSGFSHNSEREYDNASMMVDVWTVTLEQHEQSKPAFWQSQEEWRQEKESLEHTLAESVKKSEKALEVWKGGDSHPEAIKYAQDIIERHHPELHAAFHEALEALPPPPDAIEVYDNTVAVYKEVFIERAEHDYESYSQIMEEWLACSEAHQYTEPDMVENIVTLGKAGREWRAQHEEINKMVEHCEDEVKAAREIVDAGPSHPDAVKYAEETVKNKHPDIDRNFHKAVALQQEAKQAELQRELRGRISEIPTPNRDSQSAEISR